MIPGEIVFGDGDIEINARRRRLELDVVNTGDRPVQVGSHVHLPQANAALDVRPRRRARAPARHPRRHRGPVRTRCAHNMSAWFRWAAPAKCTA